MEAPNGLLEWDDVAALSAKDLEASVQVISRDVRVVAAVFVVQRHAMIAKNEQPVTSPTARPDSSEEAKLVRCAQTPKLQLSGSGHHHELIPDWFTPTADRHNLLYREWRVHLAGIPLLTDCRR